MGTYFFGGFFQIIWFIQSQEELSKDSSHTTLNTKIWTYLEWLVGNFPHLEFHVVKFATSL